MTTVFASEGAGLVSLLYDTSGLLAKKIPWLPFFFFFFPFFHLQCLAICFLPVLLMLVFMQTHGETD